MWSVAVKFAFHLHCDGFGVFEGSRLVRPFLVTRKRERKGHHHPHRTVHFAVSSGKVRRFCEQADVVDGVICWGKAMSGDACRILWVSCGEAPTG